MTNPPNIRLEVKGPHGLSAVWSFDPFRDLPPGADVREVRIMVEHREDGSLRSDCDLDCVTPEPVSP